MILWYACRSWIDVAAPTQSSSDATAVGGGLAALMVAANPSLTPEQMKAAMRSGVDVLSTTVGRVGSNVRSTLSLSDDLCYLLACGLLYFSSRMLCT